MNINSALRNYLYRVQLSAPLLYPGRRPGVRQFRAGLRPARDFLEGVESRSQTGSNLSTTCFRPQKCLELVADPHELVESQVCDLGSVMEFGLN